MTQEKLRTASNASSYQKPEKGLEQILFTWPQEGTSLTQTSSLLGESVLELFRVIQFMTTSEQPWKLIWWKSCASDSGARELEIRQVLECASSKNTTDFRD